MKLCTNCKKEISDNAKFCGYCRAKQDNSEFVIRDANSATDAEVKEIDNQHGFITWRILPGQLAVKIDEKEIAQYGAVRGLYVAPGTKALFFVNGKYAAMLDSGRYSFNELKDHNEGETSEKATGVLGFLRNAASHIANGVSALFGGLGRQFYSVVLCKGTEFPLVYELNHIQTEKVCCDIGLHFLCRITNIHDFTENLLTDTKFVTLESVSAHLHPVVQATVKKVLANADMQRINEAPELTDQLQAAIAESVQEVYPYILPVRIISVTANNEDLDNIRALKEELYVAEQELQQTQLRNDFLNKLQNEEYRNSLQQARSKVEFQALVNEVEQEAMLNEDKKEQFVLMLMAEQQIRRAKTQEEVNVALHQLQQSQMLREEEIQVLKEQIDHRATMVRVGRDQEIAMANLENGQLLAMATLQNTIAIDNEKLRWEMEIGNKRFENQLWRRQKEDEYEQEKRRADFDFQKQQMAHQLEILQQAQDIRNAREDAEHRRRMEEKQAEYQSAQEMARIMSAMTFEQIMAVNPNISPDAANALAEKFKAEAAMANSEKYDAMNQSHSQDMKDILQEMMALAREAMQTQNQTNAERLKDKQEELERVKAMSEHSADRVLDSVKTTVSTVGGHSHVIAPVGSMRTATTIACPSCGTLNVKGGMFCQECGSDLTNSR